jgi:hypothetical protein
MLRDIYKAAANGVVGVFEFLDSCVRVAHGIHLKRDPLLEHNTNVIILGNGPSLKHDLAMVERITQRNDTDLWCVNFFGNSNEYVKLRPTNYVIADPGHWEENVTDELKKDREEFLEHVTQATRWHVLFHFPYSAKGSAFVGRLSAHPQIKIRFFNNTSVPCRNREILFALYRRELAMPVCQNVLVPALFLAILSNYKRILLVGADHSWHRDLVVKNTTVMICDRHFYDDETALKPFFKNRSETYSMAEIFHIYGTIFSQYDLLDAFAHAMKVDIVNGSSLTFIDSFKQIELRDF